MTLCIPNAPSVEEAYHGAPGKKSKTEGGDNGENSPGTYVIKKTKKGEYPLRVIEPGVKSIKHIRGPLFQRFEKTVCNGAGSGVSTHDRTPSVFENASGCIRDDDIGDDDIKNDVIWDDYHPKVLSEHA